MPYLFWKTIKDFWLKDSLETLCLRLSFWTNLAVVAGKYVQYICCPPYWISRYECIISASRKLGKRSFRMWLSAQIAKMSADQQGEKKAINFRFPLSRQIETKETTTSMWRYVPIFEKMLEKIKIISPAKWPRHSRAKRMPNEYVMKRRVKPKGYYSEC